MKACLLLGAAALAAGCSQESLHSFPETAQSSKGVLERVTSFGSNPGALNMYKYVPANLPANAPLVIAMHACSQNATQYENAGWNGLADQHGFAVLYPEQASVNNPAGCFNWAGEGYVGPRDTSNLERGQGENQSIIQMIDQMATDHGIDTSRVYAMGHSGGAAQVALMIAVWPDRIAGGGIIAGIPYRCTTELFEVSGCLSPGTDRTAQAWGDLARMGNPGYSGPWPKLTIWHGSADTTVAIRNQGELLEQFTNLYGIDATADGTSPIGSASVDNYAGPGGTTLIQTVTLGGFGHATPVDPGNGCGSTGPFFSDAGLCGAEEIARFWGIMGGSNPGDTTPPTVDITSPANGATVMGAVTITLSAQDDTGVDRVEVFANGGLVGTAAAAPFQVTWNTSSLAAGTYRLRAVAYDAAGNQGADDDTQVSLQSAVMDTTAPTVQLTSPADGATLTGPTMVSVAANDDFGVIEVEVLLDGNSLGVLSAPPYTVAFDPGTVPEGVHTIAAQARDAAGNQGEAMISVTTQGGMPVDTTPPTVSFTSPADGAKVSGVIRVTADASDDNRVAAVLFSIDGERSGTGVFPPYQFIWDTTQVSTGTHTLGLTAIDPAGNVNVASIVVDVERAPVENPEPNNPNPTPNPDVDNDRWGCSTTPKGGSAPVTMAALAFALLLARRRRLRRSPLTLDRAEGSRQ